MRRALKASVVWAWQRGLLPFSAGVAVLRVCGASEA